MSAPIYFTRAKEDDLFWGGGGHHQENNRAVALTGDEARDFYQSLLEEEQNQEHRGQHSSKRENKNKRVGGQPQTAGRRTGGQHGRRRSEERRGEARARGQRGGDGGRPPEGATPSDDRDGHRLLRAAQDGDVSALRKLLKGPQRIDVNFHDGFYWTAMMCASHAGQVDSVRLLLDHGASWVGVVDTQGRDARDLAEQTGHDDVVSLLDRHGAGTAGSGNSERSAGISVQAAPQWCSVCESLYSEPEAQHQNSTLHQFNRGRLGQPATPHYCLPPSSASYRMMLRSGWNPGAGLGPEGQGPHQPVRTVLKRDQAGLGFGPTPRPKVTHFQAKDLQAVERPAKWKERRERGTTLGAKAQRRKETRQRNWERDFRSSFHIDL